MNNASVHLSEEELVRYCGRRMPPAELLAADNHLTLCDACYARMGKAQELDEKLMTAGQAFHEAAANHEVTHLTYEQLAALVDDQLNEIDREIATSHLELCARCETELNDLREVSAGTAVSPAKAHAPPQRRRPSLRVRFISLWQVPAFRLPVGVAAALAIVALLAFLLIIPLRRENAELQAKVAELEQSNGALREQAAAVEKLQGEIAAVREENNRLRQVEAGQDQLLVSLNDAGGRVTLDGQGTLSGVQVAPRYEGIIKRVLQGGGVRLPALGDLRGQAGQLMGGAEPEFKLLAPVGVVIATDRPTFRWSALEGASSYAVAIYDASLNQVATSNALTTTGWTATAALPRGRTYIWQVRAMKDGREVVAPPPAGSRIKFKVLEAAKVEEIERAERAQPKSHLVMGVIYAEAGLLDEAEREFAQLLKANPQSAIARRLLQSVRSARR